MLWEITSGKLGEAPSVPGGSIVPEQEATTSGTSKYEEDEDEMKEMQNRLQALRS